MGQRQHHSSRLAIAVGEWNDKGSSVLDWNQLLLSSIQDSVAGRSMLPSENALLRKWRGGIKSHAKLLTLIPNLQCFQE